LSSVRNCGKIIFRKVAKEVLFLDENSLSLILGHLVCSNLLIITRSREEFYIQTLEGRIDELLFQEPTTKISTSISMYYGFFAQ
jgi:hypothetical protein